MPKNSENLLHVVESLQQISNHADKLIGRGEMRRFGLEIIERSQKRLYKRRKVSGIAGCTHLLIYESNITGWTLHYSLGGEDYLVVRNA